MKAFARPGLSVAAYVHNLTTHHAYEALRRLRAELHAQGKPPSADALAGRRLQYSERGEACVEERRSITRRYALHDADVATLREGPDVWLVPVGLGAR